MHHSFPWKHCSCRWIDCAAPNLTTFRWACTHLCALVVNQTSIAITQSPEDPRLDPLSLMFAYIFRRLGPFVAAFAQRPLANHTRHRNSQRSRQLLPLPRRGAASRTSFMSLSFDWYRAGKLGLFRRNLASACRNTHYLSSRWPSRCRMLGWYRLARHHKINLCYRRHVEVRRQRDELRRQLANR